MGRQCTQPRDHICRLLRSYVCKVRKSREEKREVQETRDFLAGMQMDRTAASNSNGNGNARYSTSEWVLGCVNPASCPDGGGELTQPRARFFVQFVTVQSPIISWSVLPHYTCYQMPCHQVQLRERRRR